MPSVITSLAFARRASKSLLASPLQTMSRSVTIPISRSSSPIGMQPMSWPRINFASSITGVSGLTQSTPLCITSLTFMADLRYWDLVLDAAAGVNAFKPVYVAYRLAGQCHGRVDGVLDTGLRRTDDFENFVNMICH